MSSTTTDTASLPQTDAEPDRSRDLSDAELTGVDGGFGPFSRFEPAPTVQSPSELRRAGQATRVFTEA
ncbi:MAG TPA: hypothetical protein PK857_08950 [Hyphomicrobium sp.]|nr:hypothetical protein [Hyphomicrobium sp.]HRO49615.1 hypothetical protein [Hyphomicrobium sp.]